MDGGGLREGGVQISMSCSGVAFRAGVFLLQPRLGGGVSSACICGVPAIRALGVESEGCRWGWTREGEFACKGVPCSPIVSSAAQREGRGGGGGPVPQHTWLKRPP